MRVARENKIKIAILKNACAILATADLQLKDRQ